MELRNTHRHTAMLIALSRGKASTVELLVKTGTSSCDGSTDIMVICHYSHSVSCVQSVTMLMNH